MKFLVFFLTVFLSVIKCIACKGWINASYKDEDNYSLRWSGHLKGFALTTFMISGVILYCVPNTRFYFCRACHGMIDFVADGLKTALNPNDNDYISDDSSSNYSEEESDQTLENRSSCLTNDSLTKYCLVNKYSHDSKDIDTNRRNCVKISRTNKNEDHSHRQFEQKPNNHNFSKFTKNEYSLQLPFETIQIYPAQIVDVRNFSSSKYFCPTGRDSDSAHVMILHENGHKVLYAADEENSEPESETTQNPDEESIYDNTSDVEHFNSYLNIKEEIEQSLKTRKILEKQLLDFDRTLKNLYCSLLQKKSTKSVERNKYIVQLMETIDVVESEKKGSKRIYRKSKGTKTLHKNRKWDEKTEKTKHRRNLCPINSSVKKNVHTSYKKNSDECSFSRIPEELLQLPVIPNCVKPMIECAVRWFYGRCSSIETERPTVGNMEISE